MRVPSFVATLYQLGFERQGATANLQGKNGCRSFHTVAAEADAERHEAITPDSYPS